MKKKQKKKIPSAAKGHRKPPQKKAATLIGTLQLHHRGFGFVTPERTFKSADIFIPKHLINGAVDGDTVEVEVSPEVSSKGPEGKIVKVLKRGRTHLAGTIIDGMNGRYTVFAPLLGKQKKVILLSKEKPLQIGDRVIMHVTNWNNEYKETECLLKSYIGSIQDPFCDVAAAIEEFEIMHTFSSDTLKEAKARASSIEKEDLSGRTDLTGLPSITIDPETARDFDDAISLTKDKKGHFHLAVHIADAAHYVKPGSSLDKEAYLRANSTYLPGKCVPMLPEELSNGLCSLKPDVVRLTVTAFLSFDTKGNLLDSKIERSFIKSMKRFTYAEAFEVLQEKRKSPHLGLLRDCEELCLLLKQKRLERGSIDFALPEARVEVDERGEPQGIKVEMYDITHQLIEEFMLKTNEIVALTLAKKGKVLIYRIHESPSKENFQDFFSYARLLGFRLPGDPTHKDIQKLFHEAKNTPHLTKLSIAFIRSMKLACYSPENIGHYGLALEHYTHFTSPIRRYSDLVIQRLLFDEEPEDQNLTEIANNCSQRERISMKAEQSVVILKKLRLLQKYNQKHPGKVYEAEITRVKPFGIFFELKDLMLEGSLHISDLGNDYYRFHAQSHSLRGERTNKKFSAGDLISVQILSIDFIQQEAKFSLSHKK